MFLGFLTLLFIVLAAFLIIPFVPALIEYRRRKDKGPRTFSETTVIDEVANIEDSAKEGAMPRDDLAFLDKSQIKPVGDLLHIVGDVTIPEKTDVNGPLIIEGNLVLSRSSKINGSIKVLKDVTLKDKSIIMGHVVAKGNVSVGPSARIEGIVDTEGDIILHENAFVGGASADKSIRIASGATVGKKLSAGELITTDRARKRAPS